KRAREHARLRDRLRILAGERRRFGYRRLHELLRREGWQVNHKLAERLYREEKLALRRRGRQKRGLGGVPAGAWCPIAADQRWSLDFTEDRLADGRRFRTANLKDDCTRECPATLVDFSLPGQRVAGMLEGVARERGYPDVLVVDNGPELRGRELDGWAHDHGVRLLFIDPGKPMQNGSIESFNGRFREDRQRCCRSRPELVHEPARGMPPHRGLAARLQPAPAAHELADAGAGRVRRRSTVRQAATAPAWTRHRLAGCRCRPHRASVIGQLRILLIPGPTKGPGQADKRKRLLSGFGVVSITYATRPATRAPSSAFPRRRALWTAWKKPR
ncbi:MAG TPA: DDE-type integrase/transposase/recombinase, partial [Arthrobacter sp.]|nr:DDE-type integrase/transposase/recombinase [Arthrobacter sp.]